MLEIITESEFVATRQAVILVGGRGTRLGALASNTPKPLMQIDETSVFWTTYCLTLPGKDLMTLFSLLGTSVIR